MFFLRSVLFKFILVLATAASAENRQFPWDDLPESFIGMQTGKLQPTRSVRFHGGAAQTQRKNAPSGTGLQTYFLGVDYRGETPWQVGVTSILFDDEPAKKVANSFETVTHLGTAAELKYQIIDDRALSASLLAAAEWTKFSRGAGIRTQSTLPASQKTADWLWTLSLPVTYQLSDALWLNGEIGLTGGAQTLLGAQGFGERSTYSIGVAHKLLRRLFVYAALKDVNVTSGQAIDHSAGSKRGHIYTLGTQFALTPQSALNLYATNAFSQSPVGDDLLFYPDKSNPVMGIFLNYIPSGQGVGGNAPSYWDKRTVLTEKTRYKDGFTINFPHTIASDHIRNRCSLRINGNASCTNYFATDPEFQFEFSIEDFALESGSNFRTEAVEGVRYTIGGRWQALNEMYDHSLNLGFGISGGRDFSDPQVGILFTEAMASKAFDWGELGGSYKVAIYGKETVSGGGLAIRHDVTDSVAFFNEFTLVENDDPVWASGLLWQPTEMPFDLDVYMTNSVGRNGIGSLLSNDRPTFGLSLHFEGFFDFI
jgi:hypothetical protein